MTAQRANSIRRCAFGSRVDGEPVARASTPSRISPKYLAPCAQYVNRLAQGNQRPVVLWVVAAARGRQTGGPFRALQFGFALGNVPVEYYQIPEGFSFLHG